jgi:hypothetical protein
LPLATAAVVNAVAAPDGLGCAGCGGKPRDAAAAIAAAAASNCATCACALVPWR